MSKTQSTPLSQWHENHGGKMVDFAGWRLPVNYQTGVLAEHLATRKCGGLFDISHMGRFLFSGPSALPFLCGVLTNDGAKLRPGQAQYTLLSDEQGRPRDDAFLYQFDAAQYLLVVNAANAVADLAWLTGQISGDVEMRDVTDEMAMLAVQGPASQVVLESLADDDLPPTGRNNGRWCRLTGLRVFASRTGYTGEPLGFELFAPADVAPALWERLVESGAQRGVVPVGLGARDTLRLEAGLPLYGHEYTPDRPMFAVPTARWGVDLSAQRGDFPGRPALQRQADSLRTGAGEEVGRQIIGVAALGKGMMRQGSQVVIDGRIAGELTSGTMVPAWRFADGSPGDESWLRAIGLALLPAGMPAGQMVEVHYRDRVLPALTTRTFCRQVGDYLQAIDFNQEA